MTEQINFLLRKVTGDQAVGTEQNLRDLLQKGQCKPADLLFDFSSARWCRVGDHKALVDLFRVKPSQIPDRKIIYYMGPGSSGIMQGPHSTKEIQARIQSREICESTWIFVDGDKEWRQVRNVKILFDMLPALPTEAPAKPAPEAPKPATVPDLEISFPEPGDGDRASLTNALEGLELSSLSAKADTGTDSGFSLSLGEDPAVDQEDPTKAFSTLGLSAELSAPPPMKTTPPAPPPSAPPAPPRAPAAPVAQPEADRDTGSFDGITAQIPMEPIWLVKRGNVETVAGPFRFLEVIKLLEEGKLNKNDKISREGTNRFVKIQQQYEFNVKFVVETVVESGVERQRIVIKRRHPRVSYMTEVQITSKAGVQVAACVNVSAGGILIEMPKGDFTLGDIIDIKMLPSLINKTIVCQAMVIGKIPKIPPGFALKFENLKQEDKEAIEFFVTESLKREMQINS